MPPIERSRPSEPWIDIVARFRRVPELASLTALVEHIAAAPYSKRIFGATSMHTLVIAQTPAIFAYQEIVRVDPLGGDLLVTCQERGWRSNVDPDDPLARRVRGPHAVAVLEELLAAKRWIDPLPTAA